jgi:general stress protein YciG
MSSNQNPGNFANRPHEEVENIARKGGQSSHQGGFASMDPQKQVRLSTIFVVT